MAKKLLFTLLLHGFLTAPNLIFAGQATVLPENTTLQSDECNAPPPDSFRVTGIGGNGVDLAWLPIWEGATHIIVLSREEVTGGWTILETYPSVPGSTFTFVGLGVGSYKAKIRSICTSGEYGPGGDDVQFRIIDLMTAGRMPSNPKPVINCNQIEYLNYEWVGFRIKEIATGRTNLFEFQPEGATGHIRRVGYSNPIVAVNEDGLFPMAGQALNIEFTFQIDDKSKSTFEERRIGFVKFSPDSILPYITIGLCKDVNNTVQWKSGYEFTALTAESVIITQGGGTGLVRPHIYEKFTAQSPFRDNLIVFIPEFISRDESAIISLSDAQGHLILFQNIKMAISEYSISTAFLPSGLYFLQIRTNNNIQSIKVIKSE